MTNLELIQAGKVKVRNSPLLYSAYEEAFKTIFGRAPQCPTCGSPQGHRDWSDFEAYSKGNILTLNQTTMTNQQTFKLRDKSKIYSYDYKHANGRILRARVYGHLMDDAFAEAYINNAQSEEAREARISEFSELPASLRATIDSTEEIKLADLKVAELKEMAKQLGIEDSVLKGLNKAAIIELIEAKKIQSTEEVEQTAAEEFASEDQNQEDLS